MLEGGYMRLVSVGASSHEDFIVLCATGNKLTCVDDVVQMGDLGMEYTASPATFCVKDLDTHLCAPLFGSPKHRALGTVVARLLCIVMKERPETATSWKIWQFSDGRDKNGQDAGEMQRK